MASPSDAHQHLLLKLYLCCFLICYIVLIPPVDSKLRFYADNGLQQTVAYDYLPDRSKSDVQQEILSVLGLEHRPEPKHHATEYSAPNYLIDLYKSLLDDESGNLKVDGSQGPVVLEGEILSRNSLLAINNSDKIISFPNKIHRKSPRLRHEKERRFLFDVTEVSPEDDVMDAELRLFRDLSTSYYPQNWTCALKIYQVMEGSTDRKDRVLKRLDSKTITSKDEGWLMFNVTSALSDWIAFPQENYGLYLRVRCNHFHEDLDPRDVGLTGIKGLKKHQPFLLGFFRNSPPGFTRKVRSAPEDEKKPSSASKSKTKQKEVSQYEDDDSWNPYLNPLDRYSAGRSCQKKTLYVSFRDLGWQDWIIAPDGYAAFFCHGECSFPLSPHMNATNHAIVQTLVHLMNPFLVPKPCCAPTKLSAIMVLYFDDNSNVILKKYKNMVVKSCGCH